MHRTPASERRAYALLFGMNGFTIRWRVARTLQIGNLIYTVLSTACEQLTSEILSNQQPENVDVQAFLSTFAAA